MAKNGVTDPLTVTEAARSDKPLCLSDKTRMPLGTGH